MTGGGILEKVSKAKVPRITKILMKLTVFKFIIETSFNRKKNAAHIIPTTTAFIPSSDRKKGAYFFKFCQTG
jgi:hypothetical protein